MFLRACAIMALVVSLGGCATIINGTEQPVAVHSNPIGAQCALTREGATIANVKSTPESVIVPKSLSDVLVSCEKPGVGKATALLKSTINPIVAGNIVAGGLIGGAVDAASGAMNDYPKSITVNFPGYGPPPEPKDKKKRKPEGPPIS